MEKLFSTGLKALIKLAELGMHAAKKFKMDLQQCKNDGVYLIHNEFHENQMDNHIPLK